MAISIPLPGFNDLGRLVTPIFILMDSALPILAKRIRKSIKFTIEFRLSVPRFQISLEGLTKFGIIYVTDPLVQNMTKDHSPPLTRIRWAPNIRYV